MITEAAGEELVSSYVALRNVGNSDPSSREKRITATTRQLESMIRLSEAHARMRLSLEVELEDVQEACRLMREAIRTSAMDPRTGKIDMGMLTATTSGEGASRIRDDLRNAVLNLLGTVGNRGIRWGELVKKLAEQSSVRVEPAEFSEVIEGLKTEGVVSVVGERDRRMIRKIA